MEEWKRAVFETVEQMSKEEVLVACYLQQNTEAANLFALYERWREPTAEAFIDHQMKPYRAEYKAKLPTLLQHPREAAVLKPLGEWRKSDE